jgi:hypothetical protein
MRIRKVRLHRLIQLFAHVGKNPSVSRALRIIESRIKRQPQQSSLIELRIQLDQPIGHIEERLRQKLPALDDPDLSRLVHDEQPVRLVGCGHEEHRRRQPRRDRLEFDLHRSLRDRRLNRIENLLR